MPLPDPQALAVDWRSKAETLRNWGAHQQATAIEGCAQHLLEWWDDQLYRRVNTKEAEEISGHCRSALEKMRAKGRLTNAGDEGKPLYFLGELPSKPKPLPSRRSRADDAEPDLAKEVLYLRRSARRAS